MPPVEVFWFGWPILVIEIIAGLIIGIILAGLTKLLQPVVKPHIRKPVVYEMCQECHAQPVVKGHLLCDDCSNW